VAHRFLEAAEAAVKEYLTAIGQMDKDLEHEKERNTKLKERVKQLRSKTGSLRKASDASAAIAAEDAEDLDDHDELIGPFTASDSSGDSDSDMYYDPMTDDASSDVGSTSSEPSDENFADTEGKALNVFGDFAFLRSLIEF